MINPFESNTVDIQKISVDVFENIQEYYDFCREDFFKIANKLSVLELGAAGGDHSIEILKQQPTNLTVIEGDSNVIPFLKRIKDLTIIHDDVMLAVNNVGVFDVVVCLGVLYHLHSPMQLLELVVNYCKPKFLILDCVFESQQIQFLSEEINVAGSCQSRQGWKSCRVNLVAPFLTYVQVLDNLGYNLSKVNRISVKNNYFKSNSWMAMWELKSPA